MLELDFMNAVHTKREVRDSKLSAIKFVLWKSTKQIEMDCIKLIIISIKLSLLHVFC